MRMADIQALRLLPAVPWDVSISRKWELGATLELEPRHSNLTCWNSNLDHLLLLLLFERDRGRETERASVYWFPQQNGYNGQNRARLKPRTWNSTQVSLGNAGAPVPSSAAFQGALAGSRIKSGATRTSASIHLACKCHRQQLDPLCQNTSSMFYFLFV